MEEGSPPLSTALTWELVSGIDGFWAGWEMLINVPFFLERNTSCWKLGVEGALCSFLVAQVCSGLYISLCWEGLWSWFTYCILSFSYHIVFVKHCSWTITLSAILRVYLVEIPDNVNQYQAQNRWLSSGNLEGIIIAQKHTPSHSGLGVT